jgi:hypothetical protein
MPTWKSAAFEPDVSPKKFKGFLRKNGRFCSVLEEIRLCLLADVELLFSRTNEFLSENYKFNCSYENMYE